jgi:uncharacterized protein YfaS (alpha-2-macroglobulin family)
MTTFRRIALLCALAAPTALHGQQRPPAPVRIPLLYPRYVLRGVAAPAETTGLFFRLDAVSGAVPSGRSTVTTGRPLTAAESARLLARLPGLHAPSTPADSFFFPAQTLPPPRAGRTIAEPFPPRDSLPRPPARPGAAAPAPTLEVLRRAPEGDVDTGAEVTVTFSQPMVPLSSVGEVAAQAVPVRLTPQPAGRWRWIDARTLKFEPVGRLPMATVYTVDIPAGTRSATGVALAAPVRWTFQTPAARATGAAPQPGPTRLDPIFVVAFDQRVNPAAVLRFVHLRAGGAEQPVRLATAAEIGADDETKALTAGQDSGQWVAFRATSPLPRDAEVRVSLAPGAPSAEGPRVSDVEQFWTFRTYGPLRLVRKYCSCRPGDSFSFSFSNPLDEKSFTPGLVTAKPAVPGLRTWVSGNVVAVDGETKPNTRYTVIVSPALRDRFGQALGASQPQVFDVGPPYANLSGPEQMVVLDPMGPDRTVRFTTQGHARLRVRISRVQPQDWYRYQGTAWDGRDGPPPLPGTTVVDRELSIAGIDEQTVRVDVTPALANGLGNALVVVNALDGSDERERTQAAATWVQSTRIGLAAFSDADTLVAWATSLVDGSPIASAAVRLAPAVLPTDMPPPVAEGFARSSATTDGRGVAGFPLPTMNYENPLLVARSEDDVAFLARGTGGYANWTRQARSAAAAWYAFTDRGLYRPGETVRFKGWVRRMAPGRDGGPELLRAGPADSVAWTAYDARHNEIAHGASPLTALDGFDGSFAVPAGANLGGSSVELRLTRHEAGMDGWATTLAYDVQEFRRPEYTVAVSADEGPFFVGGSAEVTARASYFAGGALPGAPVHWQVTARPGSYTPPGWDEWRFGSEPEWWFRPAYDGGDARSETLDGATDAQGQHTLRIGFDRAVPPRPYTVRAEATVTDVNRQTWSSATELLVHPASIYVGLRTRRAWLQAGDSIDLDVVAVDVGGKPVPGRTVTVAAVRREWRQVQGAWREVVADSATCVRESAPQPVRCVFRAAEGGSYIVTATAADERGRPTRSALTVWVTGGSRFAFGPPEDENAERRIDLVPDRKTYAVGDTARILLRSPIAPARGLVTIRRNGLARAEQVVLDAPTATFSVPITEADLPNVWVEVDLVGGSDGRGGGARGVAFASGQVSLSVPPVTRSLTVKPLPRDTAAAPDAQTAVGIEVRDAAGRPVPDAEVALVVVDEAVLALNGYRLDDPLAAFYPQHGMDVQDVLLRRMVQVEEPDLEPASHTIVGRVTDARTGGYLAGAAVRVEGMSTGTVTDNAGRFRIANVASGPHTVLVSMLGYATARVAVTVGDTAPPPIRVSLVTQALQLEGVVVANGRGAAQIQGLVAEAAPNLAMARRADEAPMPSAPPPPPPPPVPAGAPEPRIAVRSNFDPLALFTPVVRTDASGRAVVPFKLPSNLTRYRVMAVAVEGAKRYGLGESAITARQPLMVRPSAPRFLNYGDRFELPVVIQNQTGAPVEVDVAGRASGIDITDPGRHVTVPAHDRVEVRLAASAARAGEAAVQVGAASATDADAAEITLPVYTPATAEAFATYGTFAGDSAVTLPLQVPADAIPSFGGIEVTTSSTALQELTDALLYLVRYPYECSEQIASRMIGVTALRDVLYAFKTEELPAPEQLRGSVQTDVQLLAARQRPDGGFGLWKRDGRDFPYVSIHAAHALVRAREKGYDVPAEVMTRAQSYLRNVPRNVPPDYPADVRRALHAYALYVRAQMHDGTVAEGIRAFLASTPRDSLTLEEAGWLVSASADQPSLDAQRAELLRFIDNRATETASTATFATRYTEGEYLLLHSERRTDGVVLEALVKTQPENPLVPKVVRGLLGHRVQGRWDNTQENAWVLIALDRYFHAFEGQTPEFVARVWLGDRFAGSHAFNGRQADRWLVSVPMRVLQEERPGSVTVGKEGPGRVYYRAGLRYAPRSLDLAPLDAGFAVSRRYDAVDDPRDVRQDADGTWHVRAGARVRVTLTMVAPSRRLHVALADPLPAGFEPVNPELQGAQEIPPAARTSTGTSGEWGWWWRRYWYEHENLRDQRAEAFTSLLPAGTYTYGYVARATTPGTFVVPPPHAEEMYSPETFGRGRTERVVIEPSDER